MAAIKTPELQDHGGYSGTQFRVGDESIFVFEIEDESYDDPQGRTILTGHDDDGNEVEVRFFPYKKEDYL